MDRSEKPARSLTIGIPCFNEAQTIGKVVDDFRRVFPEARILVVDNASTDQTGAVARQHGAQVIVEPRPGKGLAVRRLFCAADTDYLIMVDGDDTYPAEEALKLLAVAEAQGSDTVVGCRTSSDEDAFKSGHTWANRILSRAITIAFGTPCGDLFSGYRLFNRVFYTTVPLQSTGFEVETEMTLQTLDKAYLQHNVMVDFRSRPAGSRSKLRTVRDGVRVLRLLLGVLKDFKPLAFFSVVALGFLLPALAAGSFPILDYMRYRYIYHVPLAILATGLVLLAGLAIVLGLMMSTIGRFGRERALLAIRSASQSPAAQR
ncbi:MAG: hypothetical protein QOD99_280 [Chthoniobacter sp.]|jgi:glycosyltransferase involved in cell wall biosynthesis|nr:hypothetical protein [Chthoniobacter sp.]